MRQRTPGGEIGTLVAQTSVSWAVQVALLIAVFAVGSSTGSGSESDCDNCSLGLFMGVTVLPVLLNSIGLIVGLPFRLSDRRWDLLRHHGEYPLGLAAVGIIAAIIGTATGVWQLMLAGFPIVAIGLTNSFPPFGWAWTEAAQIDKKLERGRALRDNPQPPSDA